MLYPIGCIVRHIHILGGFCYSSSILSDWRTIRRHQSSKGIPYPPPLSNCEAFVIPEIQATLPYWIEKIKMPVIVFRCPPSTTHGKVVPPQDVNCCSLHVTLNLMILLRTKPGPRRYVSGIQFSNNGPVKGKFFIGVSQVIIESIRSEEGWAHKITIVSVQRWSFLDLENSKVNREEAFHPLPAVTSAVVSENPPRGRFNWWNLEGK